jgi:hypothetical protein
MAKRLRGGIVLAVLLAMTASLAWWHWHDRAPVGQVGEASRAALAESARVALRRNDWERADSLLGRLLDDDPRDPTLLLGSAIALHNRVWLPPSDGRRRSPCRTSLDRATAECRALVLMDSAAACAHDLAGRTKARLRIAQVYQNLGLYLDALVVYRQIEAVDSHAGVAQLEEQIVERLR